MSDFIESFVHFLREKPSPEHYKLWGAITLLAGVSQRRVWLEMLKPTTPNLYTMLIGPPASGKSLVVEEVSELWRSTRGLTCAPTSWTSASMIDTFLESQKSILDSHGKPSDEFSAVVAAADEFVNFCPAYDLDFLGRLTEIFNCPPQFEVKRKSYKNAEGGQLNVIRPSLTLLTGAQPVTLRSLLPEEAWGGGFTSRLIMIYSGVQVTGSVFAREPDKSSERTALIAHLRAVARVGGKFFIESDAGRRIEEWWAGGAPPKPSHPKLQFYVQRRALHLGKLALISALSRRAELGCVTLFDVERAMLWMFDAELLMPDIFRAMTGKSDIDLINELHYFLRTLYAKHAKAIPRSVVFNFLAEQCPSEKVSKIIEIAILSGKLALEGDCFRPT